MLGIFTRSPAYTLSSKRRAQQQQSLILNEDQEDTIQAIFVKTISAGAMDLAQGIRYFMTRDMGVVVAAAAADAERSDKRATNKGTSTSTRLGTRLDKILNEAGISDDGLKSVVNQGLRAGEQVLGKMM